MMEIQISKGIRAIPLITLAFLISGVMACTAALTPLSVPGKQETETPALAPTRVQAASTNTPTRRPSPIPTPTLRLTLPEDGAAIWSDWPIILTWSGPAITERQRFVVEVAGRELQIQGPQPGPEFRYDLRFPLAPGECTWAVRLEEIREGRWEVIARSEKRHFQVRLSPTPTCEWECGCESWCCPLPCPPPTEPWPMPTVTVPPGPAARGHSAEGNGHWQDICSRTATA
ncbi:MAG: hypothetical protein RMK65_00125 [Anaerolineae bacterium]|nr:hypothetical protein [Anaerolineae bacterium]